MFEPMHAPAARRNIFWTGWARMGGGRPRRAVARLTLGCAVAAALVAAPGFAQEKADAKKKSEARSKTAGKGSAQVTAVEVMPVERRDLVETLNLVGSIAATESAVVRTEIAGLVREIAVQEGQTVKKGQLLVKIDDSEIRAQTDEAESAYQLALLNLKRSEGLAKTNSVTQADLDRSEAEARTAHARFNLQHSRLEKTEIRAPFDGVVGSRDVSPGDYVNSQSIITNVDDLSRLKIEFEVPERFFRKVTPGTTFTVQLTDEKAVRGEVYFVSSSISRETRSSMVKGYLTNPPAELKPGMFANIELLLEVHKNVLVVPESSILMTPEGGQIVVVEEQGEDHVANFVRVRLGLRSKGLVEIIPLAGKLPDNTVVVASGTGAIQLFQGGKLSPRPLRKELRIGKDS
jgi:membrane fusion protein (multidrug efflux system)